jgi:threonine synthase
MPPGAGPPGIRVSALDCIRCGTCHPVADYPLGCPRCAADGQNSNLSCRYPGGFTTPAQRVPYAEVPGLGQGGTPMITLPWLDGVLVKLEAANPTGSHKDRFAAMLAAHAAASGYSAIVVGSSGNAGLAVAAYAAAAGLDALVAGFSWLPEPLAAQIRQLGAELVTFDTNEQRTAWVRRMAAQHGVLGASSIADVVVGSHPVGIEGYKEIAREIVGQSAGPPGHVIVPSSRGDLAWGLYLGFRDLSELAGVPVPRLHLAEPFPRLAAVLDGAPVSTRFAGDFGDLWSIAGDSTTVQAHAAVTRSGGSAVVVPPASVLRWYERACRHGHAWEKSSCAALAAYASLRDRQVIGVGERAVIIATSHLFKNL